MLCLPESGRLSTGQFWIFWSFARGVSLLSGAFDLQTCSNVGHNAVLTKRFPFIDSN